MSVPPAKHAGVRDGSFTKASKQRGSQKSYLDKNVQVWLFLFFSCQMLTLLLAYAILYNKNKKPTYRGDPHARTPPR